MFDKLRMAVGAIGKSKLPEVIPPKVKPGAKGFLSFFTSVKPADSVLSRTDRRLASTNIVNLRTGASTLKLIRDLVASTPDLSAAVFAYLRVGITSGYKLVAKNPDGTFNPEGTNIAQQLAQRMDYMPDYSTGFSGTWSLRSISESLAKELVMYGSCSAELVLDKARLPSRIQPISTTGISFYPDKGILRPVQDVGGTIIDLDIPTFFYTSLDQDLLDPYSSSMLEPAIKAVLFSEELIQDMQRVAKRAVHPRMYVKLVEESIRRGMPSEALHDEEAMTKYLNNIVSDIQTKINGLSPEDALVMFDSIEVSTLSGDGSAVGSEWEFLKNIANAKLSTGAKTMPAILGHESAGSQNIASSQSMMFVKSASSSVTYKLNEFYSRLFTLGVRLFGIDVVVEFKYDPIDLRPENELEAFKQTKQNRILEQLSLGLITDDEACIELTGRLPPLGYVKLAGTMFKQGGQEGIMSDGLSNGGSALNKALNPSTTSKVGGKQNLKAV